MNQRAATEIPGVLDWKILPGSHTRHERLVCLVPLLFGGQITVAEHRPATERLPFEDTTVCWDEAWDFDSLPKAYVAFLAFDGSRPTLAIRHQHDGRIEKLEPA